MKIFIFCAKVLCICDEWVSTPGPLVDITFDMISGLGKGSGRSLVCVCICVHECMSVLYVDVFCILNIVFMFYLDFSNCN